ncbi:MAG: GMC family oxidoreductase N-terminal domain-containing protein, partial [Solirubrobacterales bacterium]
MPARTVQVVRIALRTFELLPFPWRFSRMSVEARAEYMAKMESSRFSLYRDLLLLAKLLAMIGWARDARVQSAVGFESRCAVAEGEPPPSSTGVGDLEPRGAGEDCDVAIVGSGAGGAAAAAILARAGLDVMVLESGPYVDHTSYPTDPLDGLPLLYRDGGMTIASGKPAIPIPVGRTVGGTTVINSGTCFRAPREVLEEWRDAGGIGWVGDLGRFYSEAEKVLAVTPLNLETLGRNGQLCAEGAKALGASGGPISRNAGKCVQCSSCPLGCEIDAKRAAHVSYLPRAVAAGARVRAGVQVQRILTEGGRATGLSCRAGMPTTAAQEAKRNGRPPAGRDWQVRARAVISA